MMKKKALAVVGVLVVVVCMSVFAVGGASVPNSDASNAEVGRYQLIRTSDGDDHKAIFDTATGRLWMNVGPSEFEAVPAFIPVRRIDDIEEGLDLLKKAEEAATNRPGLLEL